MAFSFFNSMFPIMFGLVFVIVIGVFLFVFVNGIRTWNKNNHSPRLSVRARVVAKRTSVSHRHHHTGTGNVHMGTDTSYYATFEVESGDRMELHVSGHEYGQLAEGDTGILSFQGTRYLSFSRVSE